MSHLEMDSPLQCCLPKGQQEPSEVVDGNGETIVARLVMGKMGT